MPVLAACGTYAQHQAALVPHAEPVAFDGQPTNALAALSLGGNVADLRAPRAAAPNVGDSVPGTQLRGELALNPTPNLTLDGFYEQGLASTATPLSSTQPPVRGSDVAGAGLGIAYSFRLWSPEWRLGVAAELASWSVPWVQYSQCVSGCPNPGVATMTSGSDTVFTNLLAFVPSYRSGAWTFFGSMTLRNQPTTYEKGYTQGDLGTYVQAGDINTTLAVGAEVTLSGVRLALMIHDTVTEDPIHYGPGIAATLTLPLAQRSPPRKPPAPMPLGPPGSLGAPGSLGPPGPP